MEVKKHFFSSDYHLGHKNVIKYDNRPFKDINHMNEAIITNHNNVISNNDDFYFLGDFSFDKSKTESFLERLNGNLHFIKGNHDRSDMIRLYRKYGTYLGQLDELSVKNQQFILCHYSMRVWNRSHHGSIHLYGHSHGSIDKEPWGKSMDVGIMMNDYKPFEFSDIMKIMNKREILSIDHHERKSN